MARKAERSVKIHAVNSIQEKVKAGAPLRQAVAETAQETGYTTAALYNWRVELLGIKRAAKPAAPKAVEGLCPFFFTPTQQGKLLNALIAAVGEEKFDNWLVDRLVEELVK